MKKRYDRQAEVHNWFTHMQLSGHCLNTGHEGDSLDDFYDIVLNIKVFPVVRLKSK